MLATKADPENEELLHVLGNFYSSTRRYDDLEKLYQDLLKKKPDSVDRQEAPRRDLFRQE